MNLNTVFPLPAWLTDDEKKRYNKMKRPFLAHARDLGIKMDPFLLAQINDYLIGQLLLARAEMSLQNPDAMPTENLFKQREKLGKMLQDLGETFEKAAGNMQVVAALPTAPQPPTEGLPTAFHNSDQTDPSDPSDLSQLSPLSHPENPVNPVRNSLPVSPPISPNAVAAYTAQRNAEKDRLRSLLLPPATKTAAA